jgi:gluconokinase
LLELAASVPAGSDGLMMLPYLLPERAPLWDPDLPGAYLGLRRDHTRAHMVRAAIEGVCLQLATIVDRLDVIQPVTSLRVTGGAFRSVLWREVLAAVLARPLHAVTGAEGTALGAAALGLHALGRSSTPEGALDQLVERQAQAGSFEPDAVLVETYARARARLAYLIEGLGDMAEVLRRGPRTGASTTNPPVPVPGRTVRPVRGH